MATICSIQSIKSQVSDFVTGYISKGNTEHTIEGILDSMPHSLRTNPIAISTANSMLKEAGIDVDLNLVLPYTSQACQFLSDFVIDSPADVVKVFKQNQAGTRYILHQFSQQAFKACILDDSDLDDITPFVNTNKQLQQNIVKWKNELIQDLLLILQSDAAHVIRPILQDAGVDSIDQLVVFSLSNGADSNLYQKIMRAAFDYIQEARLDTFDFTDNEDGIIIRDVLYDITALTNFDSLLEETMKGHIKPGKKQKGDLHRVKYELVGAVDGSKQDLMGISDYDYENALNYISVELEKIISNIPIIRVNLSSKNKTKDSRFTVDGNQMNTMTIAHILQASQWLQIQLPQLAKYLNLKSTNILANPTQVIQNVLSTIFTFINEEWDSKSEVSNLLIGNDASFARKEVKKILKSSGPGLNTLMSLYDFLFNPQRVVPFTRSILKIQHKKGLAPKFNVITDILTQMVSTVAPALVEYEMDGTTYQPSLGDNPNSSNYIQKASRNKAMFTLKNYLRSSLFYDVVTDDSFYKKKIEPIFNSRASLAECLKLQDFRTWVAKLFGVENSSQFETLAALLEEAEDEFKSGQRNLYTVLKEYGKQLTTLQQQWKSGTLSGIEFHNAVTSKLSTIVGNIELETVGRALAPLLSTAPTPTFMDKNGHQLGVYRTTSLVFMFPYMIQQYKKTADDEPVHDSNYVPLRQRSNILVDNPGLLQQGDNPMYESTVSIPLGMGDEETNVEARKQPEFVQDLRQFVGDYLSLVNAKKQKKVSAMMGVQLGTYSDKTTLPMLMFNLLTKQGNMDYTTAFFADPVKASKKMYGYQVTQKLDLSNKILTDWYKILSYLKQNKNTVLLNWGLNADEKKAFMDLIDSAEVTAFLDGVPSQGIRPELISQRFSQLFKDSTSPRSQIGNKYADSTSIKDMQTYTLGLFNALSEFQGLLEPCLKLIPFNKGDNKFVLRVLNRAASDSDVQLVEKLHYDKYVYKTKSKDGEEKHEHYLLNKMLLDDLDIACNKSIIQDNETNEAILDILIKLNSPNSEDVEEATKMAQTMSHPTQMVISALSKKYWIDGTQKTFFEYLQQYFTRSAGKIAEMLNLESTNSLGNKLFYGLYSKDTDGRLKLNPAALIRIYRTFLLNTNFFRHQALDLSIKEAYEDKGAKVNVAAERYARQLTTSKRNNTMTAPIKVFNLSLLNGVNQDTVKLAVIEDLPGNVFNTIGIYKQVDEFDGCGFTSPYQARQESASLGKQNHTPVKKTFITPIHDYYAEELKWASNEITNHLMRESAGCEIDLYKVYRAMHSEKLNCDITQTWSSPESGVLDLSFLLGGTSSYYSKIGFKYYKFDYIVRTGDNTYTIWKTEVDASGQPIGESQPGEPVYINSIADLYDSLHGLHSMSIVNGKLEYSEGIHDLIYNIITHVGSYKTDDIYEDMAITQNDVDQPLRHKFIHILATNSANKRGASNVVPNDFWYSPDSVPLYTTNISLATGGEQLDAEHEADQSKITKGTQLLQCLAQKGYTYELTTKVYDAIAHAMRISSETFNELQTVLHTNPSKLPEIVAQRVVDSVGLQGNTLEIQSVISAFQKQAEENGEPFTLPLSLITSEVIKSIAPELNHVIKQKDSGLMGVLNAASGFVQVYGIKGQTYTAGSLIATTAKSIEPHQEILEQYAATQKIDLDTILRTLSVVSLNAGIDLSTLSGAEIIPLLEDALLVKSVQELEAKYLETGNSSYLMYERVPVGELQPGDWIVNPYAQSSEEVRPVKVNSMQQLQQMILDDGISFVFICKNKPVDLKPHVQQIYTNNYSENEYTSYESLFAKYTKKGDQNSPELSSLFGYLGALNPEEDWRSVTPERLQQVQEDMVNFKNHVKAFGFTLKQRPQTIATDETTGTRYVDFQSYYGGFDPTKDFEQQLQKRIVDEFIQDPSNIALLRQGLAVASVSTKLSDEKKQKIKNILQSDSNIRAFCSDNPYLAITFIPIDKEDLYRGYMSRRPDVFEEVIQAPVQKAQIIMPPIYQSQIPTGVKDISEIDENYFRKANPFYKINKSFIENNKVNVDFVIRTFRGQYNIVVVPDIHDEASLRKYGKEVEISTKDGKRIDPRTKRSLYDLPNSDFVIRRINGVETIILKESSATHEDIYRIINSDSAVVSIQPFLAKLNISNTQSIRRLLSRLRDLTTIPAFENMYDSVFQMIESGQIDQESLYTQYVDATSDYKDKYAKSLYHSFLRSLDMIATRIPTQNMSSIMPMRVASLLNSSVNNVFVTKWQQWLQGADYDIDKAFLLGYNFDEKGMFVRWSNQQQFYNPDIFEESLKLSLPSGKRLGHELQLTVSSSAHPVDILANSLVNDYIRLKTSKKPDITDELGKKYRIKLSGNAKDDLALLELTIFRRLVDRIEHIGGLHITGFHQGSSVLNRLIEKINSHNTYVPKTEGVNNYSTYITHQVFADPRNATTTYKSIDVATDAFNNPIDDINWDIQNGSIDDGHTISQTTASGAVGKDGVGIGANGTKVYLTLLNYYNKSLHDRPPFDESDLVASPYFNVTKITLNYVNKSTGEPEVWEEHIGPISDTRLTPYHKQLYNTFVNREFDTTKGIYVYDRDSAQDVGALLSMAADNAKTLNLDKLHAETDYFAMHIYLAMIGVPPKVIISYFNSDTFLSVIRSASNDLSSGNTPIISAKSFTPRNGATDQEVKDMEQLKQIYLAAKEITALAQILSINQGIKVEEEDIISQRSKCEQLYKDTLEARGINDYYFNDSHLNKICFSGNSNIKSVEQVRQKMMIANRAMRNIQKGAITLKDPFNFDRFLSEPDYAEAIIAIFDVIKYNYNVFDVVSQAPHFLQMLRGYNNVLQAYSKTNKQLNFMLNQAPVLYDAGLVSTENPSQYEFAKNMYITETFGKKDISKAKGYFQQKVISHFLMNVISRYAFKYKADNSVINCSFMTDNSLHRFVDFVTLHVIPSLINQNPSNVFLRGLEINDAETKESGIPFFGFNENLRAMGHKDFVGTSQLTSIQQGFDQIKDIKIADLVPGQLDFSNPEMDNLTVGDVFFLYNMLMKQASPRSNSLDTLFSSMNVDGTVKMEYLEYVRQIDLGNTELSFSPEEFMAYICRSKAFTYDKEHKKQVVFKTKAKPQVLKVYDVTTKAVTYSRFLIPMHYVENTTKSIIDSDRFIKAYLNNTIQITHC